MLALELGLEVGELPILDVGVGLAALVVGGEGGRAVLEEELLPGVEEGDADAVFFAQVGDRDLVEEMLPEQGDLLFSGEVATLPDQECSSARVLPLTLTKATSGFDWGNTPTSQALERLADVGKVERQPAMDGRTEVASDVGGSYSAVALQSSRA